MIEEFKDILEKYFEKLGKKLIEIKLLLQDMKKLMDM